MQKVIAVVGATAVGKTQLSLDLAEEFQADIINADSMQLYKGMDIGTAKLPVAQRRGIPHHMLDVLEVTQEANVADYQSQTRTIIHELQSSGRNVVVVGGSGLFIQALLEDFSFPGHDPEIRAALEIELETDGVEALYAQLVSADAEAASHVLPTNARRIVRALEVFRLTGEVPKTTIGELPEVIPSIRIGLRRDRSELDERINERVDLMWAQGLVDEVRGLESLGLRSGKTAAKGLGYSQVLDLLAGDCTEDEAIEATKAGTRKFARRQDSWFSRDPRITWFTASEPDQALSFIRSELKRP